MVITVVNKRYLESPPWADRLHEMLGMMNDLTQGSDETLRALRQEADAIGAPLLLVGGIAVIRHGYARTTDDRDALVSRRHAPALAERLMDHVDWERLETRQYAFVYRPTGVEVDFLVSGDLITLGSPYRFPEPDELEIAGRLEGIPVIGLHDLIYFKLLAGRMRDLADVMELCKRHLQEIDASKVFARLEPDDATIRERFSEILKQAPQELENERRFGGGD